MIPSDTVVGQYLQLIALWIVAYIIRPALYAYVAGQVTRDYVMPHWERRAVYARYIRRRIAQ